MKGFLLVLIFTVATVTAGAQRDIDANSKPSFGERLYFGGGLGFSGGSDSYGNKYYYVGLYPIVGYMLNNKTSIGTSITYQYYDYPDYGFSYSQYGAAPFVRYNFSPQLFAYSEFMILSSPTTYSTSRAIYNRWLMGIGFSQPLGARSSLNVMGLYDVLYKQSDQVFASPFVFRVFFSF